MGPFVIGSVDAINGKKGEEVEFPATTHELRQMAEYWWTERIDHDFWFFLYQQTGSSDWRWSAYIDRRLDCLHGILCKEAMDKAFDGAAARIRKLRISCAAFGSYIFRKERSKQESPSLAPLPSETGLLIPSDKTIHSWPRPENCKTTFVRLAAAEVELATAPGEKCKYGASAYRRL